MRLDRRIADELDGPWPSSCSSVGATLRYWGGARALQVNLARASLPVLPLGTACGAGAPERAPAAGQGLGEGQAAVARSVSPFGLGRVQL